MHLQFHPFRYGEKQIALFNVIISYVVSRVVHQPRDQRKLNLVAAFPIHKSAGIHSHS